jgi:hypothetical protein
MSQATLNSMPCINAKMAYSPAELINVFGQPSVQLSEGGVVQQASFPVAVQARCPEVPSPKPGGAEMLYVHLAIAVGAVECVNGSTCNLQEHKQP